MRFGFTLPSAPMPSNQIGVTSESQGQTDIYLMYYGSLIQNIDR